ncbi:MAG: DUF4230 domain-containing protein [Anaerovoracaceae bacterium]|nr:DUF4230 domain-containing protein [Anaerovoracaceae bacterium]
MKAIRPVKTIKLLIVGILIGAALLGGGWLLGKTSGGGSRENVEISAIVLQNKISAMSELAVVTYTYTELGQYESSKEFYGVKMPFTTNRFLLTYDGVIKAGIDMTEVKVDVDQGVKTVTVTLPQAEILSHEIDEDSVKIYDEKTSIFNAFTIEDYTSFYADQKKTVEKKARDKGLLTEAQTQAENAVRQLLDPVLTAAGGTGGDGNGSDGTGEEANEHGWTLRFA